MVRVCVIKLGALGDVVRTLPVLPALKRKFGESCEITWITKENAVEIFENNIYVDNVVSLPLENPKALGMFDFLYNFDVEKDATDLAKEISANEKLGFSEEGGYGVAFNLGADYYLNTIFDDELKKSNRKSYQEMMFGAAELEDKKEHPEIFLTGVERKYADDFIKENGIDELKLVGIHLGASSRWPSKSWSKEKIKDFVRKLSESGREVLLFGGKNEKESYKDLIFELEEEGVKFYLNDFDNSIREFAALVSKCRHLVCADTFAMHIALALKVPVTGLFFCTTPHEVEGYGFLDKIISPKFEDFFPHKMDRYDEELVNSISAEDVLKSVEEESKKVRVTNSIIKKDDKFLLVKRKEDSGLHSGKWGFAGGVVEKLEGFYDALKREVKEEVGLDVEGVVDEIGDYFYDRGDGKRTHGKSFLVDAKGEVELDEKELEDHKWLSLEEIDEMDEDELVPGIKDEILKVFSNEK